MVSYKSERTQTQSTRREQRRARCGERGAQAGARPGVRAVHGHARWGKSYRWSQPYAWGGSGPTTPEARAKYASPYAPFSRVRLNHRQSPHARAPSSPTQHAKPQAVPMHHQSNLGSCGAEGLAALRERERGAACQATARCATRE